jgi:probable HAF family extracellular repeat protein
VIDLAPAGQAGNMSDARDINEPGQVVGDVPSPRAVMWKAGEMTVLSESYSYALGINNGGNVVGYFWVGGPDNHAFLWNRGTWEDLGIGADPNPHGCAGRVCRECRV